MGWPTHTSDAPLVLGIESSCDETAVALVRGDGTIIAQAIASQEAEHAPYGGVVPEIAARAHAERLAPMLEKVMGEAGLGLADVDAIAATAGPGLIGGVMVGQAAAGDQPPRRPRPLAAPCRSGARLSLPAAAGVGRPLPDP